ncbi:type II secretion system protein [Candidatus Babeliales bacterium]|nr:type II secretion system protein [Candidatus Babeliales bacterium]
MVNNKAGFSLIELMVVIAIIAFLASLGTPVYFKYLAKAKQSEVVINLASIHTAEQMYFAEHGTYNSNLNEIGWKPAGKNLYTYGFNTPDSEEGKHFFVGKQNTSKSNLKKSSLTKSGFIASAAADITGKGKMDIWTIDENRSIEHIQDGIN